MSNNQLNFVYQQVERALKVLKVIVDKPMQADRSNIDAAIHRFEFTIELFWKLLKRILESKGILAVYPKDVLQQAYSGNLIDNEHIWLAMLRDRNLTLHTYNEDLADTIYDNIKLYYPVLKKSFDNLKALNAL